MRDLLMYGSLTLAILSALGYGLLLPDASNAFISLVYRSSTWLLAACLISVGVLVFELRRSQDRKRKTA